MVKINAFEAMMKSASRGVSSGAVAAAIADKGVDSKSKKIEKESKSKKSSNTKMRVS